MLENTDRFEFEFRQDCILYREIEAYIDVKRLVTKLFKPCFKPLNRQGILYGT